MKAPPPPPPVAGSPDKKLSLVTPETMGAVLEYARLHGSPGRSTAQAKGRLREWEAEQARLKASGESEEHSKPTGEGRTSC